MVLGSGTSVTISLAELAVSISVHVVAVDAKAGGVSLEGSITLAREAVQARWSIASETGVGALLANAISIHVVSGGAVALASSRVHSDRVVLAGCAGVGVVSNIASFAAHVAGSWVTIGDTVLSTSGHVPGGTCVTSAVGQSHIRVWVALGTVASAATCAASATVGALAGAAGSAEVSAVHAHAGVA